MSSVLVSCHTLQIWLVRHTKTKRAVVLHFDSFEVVPAAVKAEIRLALVVSDSDDQRISVAPFSVTE